MAYLSVGTIRLVSLLLYLLGVTMSVITSSLSGNQKKKLLSFFGNVKLSLLYKASVHGYTAAAFHGRCDIQGPTVVAAFNSAGVLFGAYTSQDYTQTGHAVNDDKAFLYCITTGDEKPFSVSSANGQYGFTNTNTGPNFGTLVFLFDNTATVQYNADNGYNFDAVQMLGNNLQLSECEVYRVEGIGSFLTKPWRNMLWTSERKVELKEKVLDYKPMVKSVSNARVLLLGPVGAGKSSFFNSINSIFRGNMTSQAMCGSAGTSLTNQFRSFTIKSGKGGKPTPLVLCDTMGLEDEPGAGLNIDDVVNIYKGHIRDRYQFNPVTPLREDAPGYQKSVSLKDQIHCVVYVVDAGSVSLMSPEMVEKLAAIRQKTNQLGIPQLLLLTKVDEACPLVSEELHNVYSSHYIQRKAQEMSAALGIPLSCVLPVKNYSQELELNPVADILLLSVLDQMLNYADSFFENQPEEPHISPSL
ncbi:hypothetical protein DPEC_G00202870 [Dallia pectoralis]|uniref:Uncharacterized protein n=1 Tax=Dallia pectoralis TaxID=75939 RepID=A0ACC2G9U0_DALPE|nr:hypothetical protein DPEC_G00202870 [Dallia pectoralis]